MAQAKLLRVLEDRRFERLGGQKSIQVDFRLISATNRPLEQFVRDSRFREDLYYRVNAFSIRLPSLRERPDRHPGARLEVRGPVLRGERNAARRKDLLSRGAYPSAGVSTGRAISASSRAPSRERPSPRPVASFGTPTSSSCTRLRQPRRRPRNHAALQTLAENEKDHVLRVLESCDWNKKEAARLLDISRGTLYRKIVEYSLRPEPRVSRNRAAR